MNDYQLLLDEVRRLAARLQIYEPRLCLNCGASSPCMTEADLKPEDPGVPCTFDITPRELFDHCAYLRDELKRVRDILVNLALACGHAPTCPQSVTKCMCGKSMEAVAAHQEAAYYVRAKEEQRGNQKEKES